MKILVYSHDGAFYGAPKSILDVTNVLQKNNHITYIIPEHGLLEEKLFTSGYDYKILPNPTWVVSHRKSDYNRWYYCKHIIKSLLNFYRLMIIAYSKNLKEVKTIKPDLIIVNTCVAPLGLIIAKRLKINVILWARESLCNKKGIYVPILSPVKIAGRIFSMADVIISPSFFLKNHMKKIFGLSKVQILPNMIDFNPKFKKSAFVPYTFGMVGSISERKGQLEFFKSMLENMPEAKLIVFGTGTNDSAQALYKMAALYPLNITIRGYESDLDVIYSSFDIYINMGIDETFGRTTVEAMRAKKLVFGRYSGATPEIISHGKNGFLFNDPDEIFTILRNYENDSEKLQLIKEHSYETSLLYSPSRVVKLIESIIKV